MSAVPEVQVATGTPRPLRRNVLVRKRLTESVTRGGLIVPDNVRFRDHIADVVAVGPECQDVQVGDVVVVADLADAGRKFKWGDEMLSQVDEDSILGVVGE